MYRHNDARRPNTCFYPGYLLDAYLDHVHHGRKKNLEFETKHKRSLRCMRTRLDERIRSRDLPMHMIHCSQVSSIRWNRRFLCANAISLPNQFDKWRRQIAAPPPEFLVRRIYLWIPKKENSLRITRVLSRSKRQHILLRDVCKVTTHCLVAIQTNLWALAVCQAHGTRKLRLRLIFSSHQQARGVTTSLQTIHTLLRSTSVLALPKACMHPRLLPLP